jgi:hypothetical protein
MEEISENYTDSEFSNKKKSFLFSKSKQESSGKIFINSNKISREKDRDNDKDKEREFNPHFSMIEKNLEKEIFNKMKSKSKLDLIFDNNQSKLNENIKIKSNGKRKIFYLKNIKIL